MYNSETIKAGTIYMKHMPADPTDPYMQKGLHPVVVIADSDADSPYVYVISCTSSAKYSHLPRISGSKLKKATYARVDQGVRKILKSKSMRKWGVVTEIDFNGHDGITDRSATCTGFNRADDADAHSSSDSRPVKSQAPSRNRLPKPKLVSALA